MRLSDEYEEEYTKIGFTMLVSSIDYLLPEDMLYRNVYLIKILKDLYRDGGLWPYRPALPDTEHRLLGFNRPMLSLFQEKKEPEQKSGRF